MIQRYNYDQFHFFFKQYNENIFNVFSSVNESLTLSIETFLLKCIMNIILAYTQCVIKFNLLV